MRLTNKTPEEEENTAEASFTLPKVPANLKAELDRFSDRNCLVALENSYDGVCLSCLKAHALAEARKLNLSPKAIDAIKDSFDGKIGHNGYYMDQDKMIRVKRA